MTEYDMKNRGFLTETEFEILGNMILSNYRLRSNFVQEERVGPYRLRHKLGEGSVGIVRAAVHETTGDIVAIKIVKKGDVNDMTRLDTEIKAMLLLQHKNILRLEAVLESSAHVFFAMELCGGGNLYEHMNAKPLSEPEARYFFQQVIAGVKYCHEKGVAHRDLKLDNLMLDNHGIIKIADFGHAGIFREGWDLFSTQLIGGMCHLAPERIRGDPYSGTQNDVWSLGIILYQLVTAVPPFVAPTPQQFCDLVIKVKFSFPENIPLSEDFKSLIMGMLVGTPEARLTVDQISRHPWMTTVSNFKAPSLTKFKIPISESSPLWNQARRHPIETLCGILKKTGVVPLFNGFPSDIVDLSPVRCKYPDMGLTFTFFLSIKNNETAFLFRLEEGQSRALSLVKQRLIARVQELEQKYKNKPVNEGSRKKEKYAKERNDSRDDKNDRKDDRNDGKDDYRSRDLKRERSAVDKRDKSGFFSKWLSHKDKDGEEERGREERGRDREESRKRRRSQVRSSSPQLSRVSSDEKRPAKPSPLPAAVAHSHAKDISASTSAAGRDSHSGAGGSGGGSIGREVGDRITKKRSHRSVSITEQIFGSDSGVHRLLTRRNTINEHDKANPPEHLRNSGGARLVNDTRGNRPSEHESVDHLVSPRKPKGKREFDGITSRPLPVSRSDLSHSLANDGDDKKDEQPESPRRRHMRKRSQSLRGAPLAKAVEESNKIIQQQQLQQLQKEQISPKNNVEIHSFSQPQPTHQSTNQSQTWTAAKTRTRPSVTGLFSNSTSSTSNSTSSSLSSSSSNIPPPAPPVPPAKAKDSVTQKNATAPVLFAGSPSNNSNQNMKQHAKGRRRSVGVRSMTTRERERPADITIKKEEAEHNNEDKPEHSNEHVEIVNQPQTQTQHHNSRKLNRKKPEKGRIRSWDGSPVHLDYIQSQMEEEKESEPAGDFPPLQSQSQEQHQELRQSKRTNHESHHTHENDKALQVPSSPTLPRTATPQPSIDEIRPEELKKPEEGSTTPVPLRRLGSGEKKEVPPRRLSQPTMAKTWNNFPESGSNINTDEPFSKNSQKGKLKSSTVDNITGMHLLHDSSRKKRSLKRESHAAELVNATTTPITETSVPAGHDEAPITTVTTSSAPTSNAAEVNPEQQNNNATELLDVPSTPEALPSLAVTPASPLTKSKTYTTDAIEDVTPNKSNTSIVVPPLVLPESDLFEPYGKSQSPETPPHEFTVFRDILSPITPLVLVEPSSPLVVSVETTSVPLDSEPQTFPVSASPPQESKTKKITESEVTTDSIDTSSGSSELVLSTPASNALVPSVLTITPPSVSSPSEGKEYSNEQVKEEGQHKHRKPTKSRHPKSARGTTTPPFSSLAGSNNVTSPPTLVFQSSPFPPLVSSSVSSNSTGTSSGTSSPLSSNPQTPSDAQQPSPSTRPPKPLRVKARTNSGDTVEEFASASHPTLPISPSSGGSLSPASSPATVSAQSSPLRASDSSNKKKPPTLIQLTKVHESHELDAQTVENPSPSPRNKKTVSRKASRDIDITVAIRDNTYKEEREDRDDNTTPTDSPQKLRPEKKSKKGIRPSPIEKLHHESSHSPRTSSGDSKRTLRSNSGGDGVPEKVKTPRNNSGGESQPEKIKTPRTNSGGDSQSEKPEKGKASRTTSGGDSNPERKAASRSNSGGESHPEKIKTPRTNSSGDNQQEKPEKVKTPRSMSGGESQPEKIHDRKKEKRRTNSAGDEITTSQITTVILSSSANSVAATNTTTGASTGSRVMISKKRSHSEGKSDLVPRSDSSGTTDETSAKTSSRHLSPEEEEIKKSGLEKLYLSDGQVRKFSNEPQKRGQLAVSDKMISTPLTTESTEGDSKRRQQQQRVGIKHNAKKKKKYRRSMEITKKEKQNSDTDNTTDDDTTDDDFDSGNSDSSNKRVIKKVRSLDDKENNNNDTSSPSPPQSHQSPIRDDMGTSSATSSASSTPKSGSRRTLTLTATTITTGKGTRGSTKRRSVRMTGPIIAEDSVTTSTSTLGASSSTIGGIHKCAAPSDEVYAEIEQIKNSGNISRNN